VTKLLNEYLTLLGSQQTVFSVSRCNSHGNHPPEAFFAGDRRFESLSLPAGSLVRTVIEAISVADRPPGKLPAGSIIARGGIHCSVAASPGEWRH
jgi:hypothetical protein